jgi:hypothetical protein
MVMVVANGDATGGLGLFQTLVFRVLQAISLWYIMCQVKIIFNRCGSYIRRLKIIKLH